MIESANRKTPKASLYFSSFKRREGRNKEVSWHTATFSILLRILLTAMPCVVLLSCKSASSLLLSPNAAQLNRRAPDIFDVRMETTKGEILIEIHRAWSPHGADRFYNLVRAGYYNDSYFYRVMPHWAQFGINGDPKISNAWRTETIPDDPRIESNTRGTVAFAFAVPNGRTTQVFINLTDNSTTHDAEFVPFGKIIRGMELADSLNGEYGENAGGGIRGGKQAPLFEQGNAYLKQNFRRLDRIIAVKIVSPSREVGLDERP
jgi:homoserine O-acetyltransferase